MEEVPTGGGRAISVRDFPSRSLCCFESGRLGRVEYGMTFRWSTFGYLRRPELHLCQPRIDSHHLVTYPKIS